MPATFREGWLRRWRGLELNQIVEIYGHSEIGAQEQPDLDDDAMIISFGWTSDAMLAGFKDTTRRAWSVPYIEKLQAKGKMVDRYVLDAWDALPRVKSKHPQKVARVQLKVTPYLSRELPATDFRREGFEWLTRYGYTLGGLPPREIWDGWSYHWTSPDVRPDVEPLYVVRFNVVELTQAGRDRRDQLLQEGKEVWPLPMVA